MTDDAREAAPGASIGRSALVVVAPFPVPDEWIDHNGHMNLARYADAFYRAVRHLSDALGFSPEFKERTSTASFAANLAISYRREVVAGERIRLESRIIDHDRKRIHAWHELILDDSDTVAATAELLSLNIDRTTRRVADMPAEALERVAAMCAAHRSLPTPDGVSHAIRLGDERSGAST